MEQDILLKSSYDDKTKFNMDIIDYRDYQIYLIYLDYLDYYLPFKNKDWSDFKDNIFFSIQNVQSYAMAIIKEQNIPKTYQQAVEKYKKGLREMLEIRARQAKGEFSEKIWEDMTENLIYDFIIKNKVFLAVVSLIHLQERLLRDFLWHHELGNSLSKYIYCEKKIDNEINKISAKQKNNHDQEFGEDSSVVCLGKLSSSIGFKKLLKLIDKEKYKITDRPFWADIHECNDFCNHLKHQSNKIVNNLLKNNKAEYSNFFYPTNKKISENFCVEMFSLEIFFRYIKAFEDFWMYILENSVKPEDRDKFTDTMIREQGNVFIEKNKKFPWHQK